MLPRSKLKQGKKRKKGRKEGRKHERTKIRGQRERELKVVVKKG